MHDFAQDDIEDNSDGEDGDEEGEHDAGANTEQNGDNGIPQMLTKTELNCKEKEREVDEGACNDPTTESREPMILRAAEHIQMARAHLEVYQALVLKARDHSKNNVPHSVRSYTFVVDYGKT